jgi:hypothetical protein
VSADRLANWGMSSAFGLRFVLIAGPIAVLLAIVVGAMARGLLRGTDSVMVVVAVGGIMLRCCGHSWRPRAHRSASRVPQVDLIVMPGPAEVQRPASRSRKINV